jgi:hypothetical protein
MKRSVDPPREDRAPITITRRALPRRDAILAQYCGNKGIWRKSSCAHGIFLHCKQSFRGDERRKFASGSSCTSLADLMNSLVLSPPPLVQSCKRASAADSDLASSLSRFPPPACPLVERRIPSASLSLSLFFPSKPRSSPAAYESHYAPRPRRRHWHRLSLLRARSFSYRPGWRTRPRARARAENARTRDAWRSRFSRGASNSRCRSSALRRAVSFYVHTITDHTRTRVCYPGIAPSMLAYAYSSASSRARARACTLVKHVAIPRG